MPRLPQGRGDTHESDDGVPVSRDVLYEHLLEQVGVAVRWLDSVRARIDDLPESAFADESSRESALIRLDEHAAAAGKAFETLERMRETGRETSRLARIAVASPLETEQARQAAIRAFDGLSASVDIFDERERPTVPSLVLP